MADPSDYQRGYNYTLMAAPPGVGQQLNNDLSNIQKSINELVAAVKDVRRSDGKLKNGIVTADSVDILVLQKAGIASLDVGEKGLDLLAAADAAGARSKLGLVPGKDVATPQGVEQAIDFDNAKTVQPGLAFGASGSQADDVAAVTALMADAAGKPASPAYLNKVIQASSLYTHPDAQSFLPVLNAFFASGEADGKWVRFDRKRAWYAGTARPTALGPQGQYITPPQRCTLEWEREWDFTEWPLTSGSPNVLRREGSYGSANAITNSGGLVKGTTTVLTLGAGNTTQYRRGQRVLIRATAQLNTLVGDFTLADAQGTAFCARAEDAIVKSVSSTQVTLMAPVQDNYPPESLPVIQPYVDEPGIRLINPLMDFPGYSTGGDRAVNIFLGRNTQIEGGRIRNAGTDAVRILSSMGGAIRDLEVHASDRASTGGVFYIGDATSDFLLESVTTWGGGQPFMQSGSGSFYGITRRLKYKDCVSYGAASTGFSQHNLATDIEYDGCWVFGCGGSGWDLRAPNTKINRGGARNIAANAVVMRIAPNGTKISQIDIDGALSGIVLENSNSPEYDYDPGDLLVRDSSLKNIGGVGSKGGIAFAYSQLRGGAVPTLGKLRVLRNYVHMVDNSKAYEIAGKWTNPIIRGNEADGAGSGNACHIHDGGNGVGNGPIDLVFEDHVYPSNMAHPLIANDTFATRIDRGHTCRGETSSTMVTLQAAKTLSRAHAGMAFNNNSAPALVVVTLPGATPLYGAPFATFYVTHANGIRLQATTNDTFQIGKGAAGAANGTLTSTAVGAWCRITALTSTIWMVEVSAAADWTIT